MKLKSSRGIAFHVLIHLVVTALLIREPLTHLPLFAVIGITHFLIDWLKLRYPTSHRAAGFLVDQVLHFIVLIASSIIFTSVVPVLPGWLLLVTMIYAFFPLIIMLLWLLAIDLSPALKKKVCCISWGQRRLLPFSQLAGLPLLILVGLGIVLM